MNKDNTCLLTGFTELDQATGGLNPGELIVIGARPAMVETAILVSMLNKMSIEQQTPTAVFTMRMSNAQFVRQLLIHVCKGNPENAQPLADAPIYVDDTPALTLESFMVKATRLVCCYGLKCIFIDSLQLMKAELTDLRRSAQDLGIPIVMFSQLNRSKHLRYIEKYGIEN